MDRFIISAVPTSAHYPEAPKNSTRLDGLGDLNSPKFRSGGTTASTYSLSAAHGLSDPIIATPRRAYCAGLNSTPKKPTKNKVIELLTILVNSYAPIFKPGSPSEQEMKMLTTGTKIEAIAEKVFAQPIGDQKKLDQLAKLLNGNSDFISEELYRKIDKASSRILMRTLYIAIKGQDDDGSYSHSNYALTERRSNFIKSYLIMRGVDSDRLLGYWTGQPTKAPTEFFLVPPPRP